MLNSHLAGGCRGFSVCRKVQVLFLANCFSVTLPVYFLTGLWLLCNLCCLQWSNGPDAHAAGGSCLAVCRACIWLSTFEPMKIRPCSTPTSGLPMSGHGCFDFSRGVCQGGASPVHSRGRRVRITAPTTRLGPCPSRHSGDVNSARPS